MDGKKYSILMEMEAKHTDVHKNRYCWQARSENNLLTKSTNDMRPDLENGICYLGETQFDHSTAGVVGRKGNFSLL